MISALIIPMVLSLASGPLVDDLKWSSERTLTWEDFAGPVESEKGYSAFTYWRIDYSYSWTSKGDVVDADFEIAALFETKRSWSLEEKQEDWLLKHEQGHFDIAELLARRMREKVSQVKFSTSIDDEANSLFQTTLNDCEKMQVLYDEETNHGMNTSEQLRWQDWIADELEKLSDFAQ